jgi:sugar lactone lactonase YvrE
MKTIQVLLAAAVLAATQVSAAEALRATEMAITPGDLAVDRDGNLYVAEFVTNQVLRIDAKSGTVKVLASNIMTEGAPEGIALDGRGNVFVADGGGNRVLRIDASGLVTTFAGNRQYGTTGDGGPALEAAIDHPFSVAADASGNVFIAEWVDARVRKVDAVSGIITTLAGTGALNPSGDGGPASEAGLPNPYAVTVDAAGNVFITQWQNYTETGTANRIRRVDGVTGVITTLAGNGYCGLAQPVGVASQASLCAPTGVATDAEGNVYIVDVDANQVRKVDVQSGMILTIAGSGARDYSGDGGLATAATLNVPLNIAVDPAGNVFISDYYNYRIRRIDHATGVITTFAGNGTPSVRLPPPHRRIAVR